MKLKCYIVAVLDCVIPIFKIFIFLLLKGSLEIPNVESLFSMMPLSLSKHKIYVLKAKLENFLSDENF